MLFVVIVFREHFPFARVKVQHAQRHPPCQYDDGGQSRARAMCVIHGWMEEFRTEEVSIPAPTSSFLKLRYNICRRRRLVVVIIVAPARARAPMFVNIEERRYISHVSKLFRQSIFLPRVIRKEYMRYNRLHPRRPALGI